MTSHLKLAIHITEPWDFERKTGVQELGGWSVDHEDEANAEWEIILDEGFDYHGRRFARLLVSPRYVGEHLSRIFDAVVGFPVRIAHRSGDGGWHFAFAGMLSVKRHYEDKDDKEETI
ncbi:hypothetical protein C1T17_09800 [Sphingobium sp. SCG-1]|uniref:hypothetical protein n=1 Tax=Sphingobium sp. SCG-1 TaxID=2072936 RepID=UPI000CD694AD|nr:hypothetical protein [Sphingobium sp. SCG-1]AUW58353.1 hypothetical protein C1T17_09800 [Sphingobium sp. SCG-1]